MTAAEHEDRPVTTLELFFDLVFVFTITQLTVFLAHDLSFAQVGRVALIFSVLFWMYGAYGIVPLAYRALAAAAALATIPLGSALAAVAEYWGLTLVLVVMLVAEDRRAGKSGPHGTSGDGGNSDGDVGVRLEEEPAAP